MGGIRGRIYLFVKQGLKIDNNLKKVSFRNKVIKDSLKE